MNDLVEKKDDDPSARFRAMADRVDHNRGIFGGAVVIVPPAGAGDPIEFILLDVSADAVQFWATIKGRIDKEIAKLDENSRNKQAFGRY